MTDLPVSAHGLAFTTEQAISRGERSQRLIVMLVHGIESLLTFNVQDFLRYDEIRVLDATALAGARA